jgi:hypothetical protein
VIVPPSPRPGACATASDKNSNIALFKSHLHTFDISRLEHIGYSTFIAPGIAQESRLD